MNTTYWLLIVILVSVFLLSWLFYTVSKLRKEILELIEKNRAALETINNLRNFVQQRTETNEAETIEKEQNVDRS